MSGVGSGHEAHGGPAAQQAAAAATHGAEWPDPGDVRLATGARGLLRVFNEAEVLGVADVHVAQRLMRLGGEDDDVVLLAAALAVRAPRLGHVCADLATVHETVAVDTDRAPNALPLPWPAADGWIRRVGASPLTVCGEDEAQSRPLRLVDARLYLDRYWREERAVAADLHRRSAEPVAGVDLDLLADGLARLFTGDAPDLQRLAAAAAVLRRLAVVAGGPGTGKTTTVARILALLFDQAVAAGAPPPRVALAAPTGKAAARLQEATHGAALDGELSGAAACWLRRNSALTLHRLLGQRPGGGRFRHHRGNRLPHDVVVVDETSMVPLSLMARLVDAARPDARLVLVGDAEQLASVEAGAVLGDIVGPAARGLRLRPSTAQVLERVTGQAVTAGAPPEGTSVGDGIVVLRRVHRFGGGIAELAAAVQRGDADAACAVLAGARDDVRWLDADAAATGAGAEARLAPVRDAVVANARAVVDRAREGDAAGALRRLAALRVLCAHRHGPAGVSTWGGRIEGWLAAAVDDLRPGDPWYVGRPLLVTRNDYGLRLYNGDVGVVVAGPQRVTAAFDRGGTLLEVAPTRLAAVETVHAMTVHKSQGSQFEAVVLLLPEASSPILTRELLYTAVTRATTSVTVVGPEEAVRAAVERPVARASGLRDALWGPATP